MKEKLLPLAALGLVLGAALAVRAYDLGSRPANLTADELDELQNVYRVLEGKAGGFFGLDWNQAPNLVVYSKAGVLLLFGDSVAGFRAWGVLVSTATLLAFYPLARRRLEVLPALCATALFASSLWSITFSRTPWVATSAALAAVLVAYLLDVALARQRPWLWALLGAALALALYGYFAGRALVPVVAVCFGIALLRRDADPKALVRGLVLASGVCLLLIAPQLKTQLERWDYANTRPRAVSIFSLKGEPYLGDRELPAIIANQTLRTAKGFLLLDRSVMHNGLWARHRPQGWGLVDAVTGVCYWLGLGAGVYYWRRYAYWWAFLLIPLFLTQVFSVGTPDSSRALVSAPFLFLFAGLGLQQLLTLAQLTRRPVWRPATAGVCVAIVLAVGAFNVERYFRWIEEPAALRAREPAVAVGEFPLYSALAREYAKEGRLLSREAWEAYRASAGLGGP